MELCLNIFITNTFLQGPVEFIIPGRSGNVRCLMCMIARVKNHSYLLVIYSCHEYNDWSGSFLLSNASLRSLKHSDIGPIFTRLCSLNQVIIETKLYLFPLDRWLVEFEQKPKIYIKWIHDYLRFKNSSLIRCHSSAQRHHIRQIKYFTKRVDTLQKRLKNITFSFYTKCLMSIVLNAECTRLNLRCLLLMAFENITNLSDCQDKSYFFDDTNVSFNNTRFSCGINDRNDFIFSKYGNIPPPKTLIGNITVLEEDNHEQQEIVSDSEVHATKLLGLFCTKLQNKQEHVEPSVQNLSDQNRECSKSVSLKSNTIDLKLVRERPKVKFQCEKLEDFFLPFSREKNYDFPNVKSALRPYTRSLHFEHNAPLVALVNPVFGNKNDSEDKKKPPDHSCSEQERSCEQEPESRRGTSSLINNHEANSYTNAAAALPLDAPYSEVGIDGHVRVSDGLSKQVLEVIPKVAEANDVRTISDSSAREDSAPDTARDNALPNPDVDNAALQGFEPLMSIIDKIAEGQSVPPQVTMRYEMLRFCTLRSYPTENKPYKIRLAQAGFYYAKTGDEVVCYCCASRKNNWTENDRPLDIHRKLNPNCSFLVRNSEVNVPVSDSLFASERSTAQSHRQQSFENHQHAENSPSTREAVPQSENDDRPGEQSRGLPQGTPHIATTEHLAISSGYRAKEPISHGNFVQVDTPRPTRQEVQQQSLKVSNAISNSNHIGSSQSSQGWHFVQYFML